LIRLDAFGYTTKKKGTNCFFVEPEVWQLLTDVQDIVGCRNTEILAELHEHYTLQQRISEHGLWVYDFALPMLCLQVCGTSCRFAFLCLIVKFVEDFS
jgi:sucrose phosphorylase